MHLLAAWYLSGHVLDLDYLHSLVTTVIIGIYNASRITKYHEDIVDTPCMSPKWRLDYQQLTCYIGLVAKTSEYQSATYDAGQLMGKHILTPSFHCNYSKVTGDIQIKTIPKE